MPQMISPSEFSTDIQDYIAYKSSIQGCSPKTVQEYQLDLRTFFRFLLAREQGIDYDSEEFEKIDVSCFDIKRLKAVKPDDIYDFLYYVNLERKNAWSARARKLSALRSLYRYMITKKHAFKDNPTADIDSPKPKKTLPKVLTVEESLALLHAVENDKDSPFRLRDYAILTLFLNCGMRVSELAGINKNDVDSNLLSLRVLGKGNKERVIYLNDACRRALADYQVERNGEKYAKVNDKALFLSRLNKRMSVKTIQAMVYKYLRLAGLESKHYSVHKLRHTAATLMYQSGHVDVRVLKEILGHEQLNTTQIYTHVSNKEMETAMEQNPLAEEKRKK